MRESDSTIGKTLIEIGYLDKDGQLAISQHLDLETTRGWLFEEISARFWRLEQDELADNEREE